MKNSIYVKKNCKNIINITSVVTLHDFSFDKDYIFSGEKHDFWELLYVAKGDFLVTADDKSNLLSEGEAIFHKPNEFHENRTVNSKGANVFVISFVCRSSSMKYFVDKKILLSEDLRKVLSTIIDVGRKTYILPYNNPKMKELILREDCIIGGAQLVKTYLEQFLILLLQDAEKSQKTKIYDDRQIFDNMLAKDIIYYLNSNIYNNITIDDVCHRVNYGKTYISNYFKRYTGKSIMKYYIDLKINEAVELLNQNEYQITQISNLLCFQTPNYFSRVFKNKKGKSPKEYTKTRRNY